MKQSVAILLFLSMVFVACSNTQQHSTKKRTMTQSIDTATFGSGCFWCSEAIFERVKGVVRVTSGYSGGTKPHPDYQLVSSGHTRYAEVVQIFYHPDEIAYTDLLKIFWGTHDPTMVNRQGVDIGPQYRSVIFYHNNKQKEWAEQAKKKLEEAQIWTKPIATEISPYKNFYKAEKHHQNYYKENPTAGYCRFVITPKIKKFDTVFKKLLK